MIKTVHEDDLEAWYRLTELELGQDLSITDFDLEDEDLLTELFSEKADEQEIHNNSA